MNRVIQICIALLLAGLAGCDDKDAAGKCPRQDFRLNTALQCGLTAENIAGILLDGSIVWNVAGVNPQPKIVKDAGKCEDVDLEAALEALTEARMVWASGDEDIVLCGGAMKDLAPILRHYGPAERGDLAVVTDIGLVRIHRTRPQLVAFPCSANSDHGAVLCAGGVDEVVVPSGHIHDVYRVVTTRVFTRSNQTTDANPNQESNDDR